MNRVFCYLCHPTYQKGFGWWRLQFFQGIHVSHCVSSQLLTLLLWWTPLVLFSSVNLSALFCLSWNMREPRLDERLSSSIMTSFGTLIFFPRFIPTGATTHIVGDALVTNLIEHLWTSHGARAETRICCRLRRTMSDVHAWWHLGWGKALKCN